MGYVYATDDRGRQHLIHLECDGCDATIKPNPRIAESGWMKTGTYDGLHSTTTGIWCPKCYEDRR